MKILQERLRQTRSFFSLTQDQFAEKCGLTGMSISHYELGKRTPSLENIKKISEAFEVSIDWLVDGYRSYE